MVARVRIELTILKLMRLPSPPELVLAMEYLIGFEPMTTEVATLPLRPLGYRYMVPEVGFEPTTLRI